MSADPFPSPEGDDDRVARARGGDLEAFTLLVEEHHARVRSYLAASAGGTVGRDVIDDLAQEVFLDAFRTLPSYRADAPFVSWLLGIARHRVLRHLRSAGRRDRSFAALLRQVLIERAAQDDRTRWETRDTAAAALERCMEDLPERSVRLVRAHYFEGKTLVSLAALWGQSEGALRVALLRVRQALRGCLSRRLAEEER